MMSSAEYTPEITEDTMRTASALYSAKSAASRQDRRETPFLETVVGRNGGLRAILAQIEAVANTNATVLISGET